jgi:hypothetical protein
VRIFLSYASERRAAAEPIAFALRGRGYDVFLDKTDLPPAGDYAAQIEQAIKRSDFVVFLVSPESVLPERFTLTELAFARRKWRSARGRVIPVMIAPTPMKDVPAYLTSVQIMHPEGNAAAEVASFVDSLTPTPAASRILPAALGLGVISGLASDLKLPNPMTWLDLDRHGVTSQLLNGTVFLGKSPEHFYVAPYAFAVVLAVLLVVWNGTTAARALWVFPISLAAWVAAFWLAAGVTVSFQVFDKTSNTPIPPPATQCMTDVNGPGCVEINKYRAQLQPIVVRFNWLVGTVAGALAGFVGSLVTILLLRCIASRVRPLDAIVLVTFTGTITGMVLNRFVVGDQEALKLLFVVWQVGVAMAIGWQFTKSPQ